MKPIRLAYVSLVLTLILAAAHASAAPLGVGKVGIGAYGLTNIPLVQDDADPGSLIGARARVGVLPILALEGHLSMLSSGDPSVELDGATIELEAPKMTSYGLNALLKSSGVGLTFYLTAGIGTTKVEIEGASENEPTYNLGLGAEIGLGMLSLDVSPRLFIINTEDGASRKNLGILAGLTYYLN